MKVPVLVLILCLFVAAPVFGQSTTVSSTVTDTSGQAWKSGTFSFVFKVAPTNPAGPYLWNGSAFNVNQTIQGAMDTSGHFSVSIPSNTSITPAQSTWVLTLCPVALGNTQCYSTSGLTITGATQDLSSIHPPAITIDLAHPAYPFVMAYKNQEFTTAPLGGLYYDWTQQHYFICETVSPFGLQQWYGGCTNWVKICQAGDLTCGFASSCPPNSFDTGVLSEHPLGTCYDSSHWTWDDGTNKQNMQAGTSNSLCAGTNPTQCQENFIFGQSNDVETTLANATDHFSNNFVAGRFNKIGGPLVDAFAIGGGTSTPNSNTIFVDSTSHANDVMCLMEGCSGGSGIISEGGASVSHALLAGFQNVLIGNGASAIGQDVFQIGTFGTVEVDDTSTLSSIFRYGESTNLKASGASGYQDYYALGTNTTDFGSGTQTAVGASTSRYHIDVGFANTFASSAGHTFKRVFGFGETLSFSASTVNVQDMLGLGDALTLANCSHCFAIGENISSSTSNTIKVGLSSTPGLVWSASGGNDNVQRSPLTFAALPACAGGTEGSFASVTDSTTNTIGATITGGGTNHVLGYCNGTNWVAATGVTPAQQPAILAAPTVCNLSSDVTSIPAVTPTTIITCAATAPSSGCPCRAIVSWSILGIATSSTEHVTGKINDGTSDFAQASAYLSNQITDGNPGVNRSATSPNRYNNSQAVTFTLTGESDHTWTAHTASTYLGATTQVQVTYLSSN